jgi:hypothetical protein
VVFDEETGLYSSDGEPYPLYFYIRDAESTSVGEGPFLLSLYLTPEETKELSAAMIASLEDR